MTGGYCNGHTSQAPNHSRIMDIAGWGHGTTLPGDFPPVTLPRMGDTALAKPRYGHTGKVLFVDLGEQRHWVETIDESVYRAYLGGYGLGAWLMWKHFPAGTDPARTRGVLRDRARACSPGCARRSPGRIQIVGKSPLTGTWADSNSGGSVCSHLRQAGYDALVVRGKAAEPTLLVIRDGEVTFEPAGELWGQGDPADVRRDQEPVRRQARRRRVGDRTCRRAAAADRLGDERPLSRVRSPGLRRDLRQQEPEGDRRRRARRGLALAEPDVFKAICKQVTRRVQARPRRCSRGSSRTWASPRAGSAGCTG